MPFGRRELSSSSKLRTWNLVHVSLFAPMRWLIWSIGMGLDGPFAALFFFFCLFWVVASDTGPRGSWGTAGAGGSYGAKVANPVPASSFFVPGSLEGGSGDGTLPEVPTAAPPDCGRFS